MPLPYNPSRHAPGRPLPAQTVNLARIKEFRDRGDPLLVGTFGERQAEGSMAVFGSREGVEEGRGDDRFVNEVWCSLDAAGVGRGRERDLSGL